jgi:hypothetical protein
MNEVTVTRKHIGSCVPSMAGIGGFILQDDVTIITTARGSEIVVTGTTSTMSGVDVTDEAPKGDHEAIVAFWQGEAERWAADAAHLAAQADMIEVEGQLVTAPGFDEITFAAGLAKARKIATLHIRPSMTKGHVQVTSARTGASYLVSRTSCTCMGHMGHGHCYHRAAAIACADLYGIEVCQDYVLGFDEAGHAVTYDQRAAQLQEVA